MAIYAQRTVANAAQKFTGNMAQYSPQTLKFEIFSQNSLDTWNT